MALKGARELEQALEALGKQTATRIGRKAVRDSAKHLQASLILTAPYRPAARPKRSGQYGHLRDNLKVVTVRAKKPGLLLYRVSTGDAFWGNFLEFGTVNLAPRPWMRPAVDREKTAIVTMQIRTLGDGIDKAARRAARKAKAA
jgi:HK97 gp10 family phage protein